jgi:hypothetical protein
MNSLLKLWDAIVATSSVIAIAVTAIGMIVGLIQLSDALKRIALIIGLLILLLIMPPIILSMWRALSLWQQLGLAALFNLVAMRILRCGADRANVHRARH